MVKCDLPVRSFNDLGIEVCLDALHERHEVKFVVIDHQHSLYAAHVVLAFADLETGFLLVNFWLIILNKLDL